MEREQAKREDEWLENEREAANHSAKMRRIEWLQKQAVAADLDRRVAAVRAAKRKPELAGNRRLPYESTPRYVMRQVARWQQTAWL